jgi:hypothetical protein
MPPCSEEVYCKLPSVINALIWKGLHICKTRSFLVAENIGSVARFVVYIGELPRIRSLRSLDLFTTCKWCVCW